MSRNVYTGLILFNEQNESVATVVISLMLIIEYLVETVELLIHLLWAKMVVGMNFVQQDERQVNRMKNSSFIDLYTQTEHNYIKICVFILVGGFANSLGSHFLRCI